MLYTGAERILTITKLVKNFYSKVRKMHEEAILQPNEKLGLIRY